MLNLQPGPPPLAQTQTHPVGRTAEKSLMCFYETIRTGILISLVHVFPLFLCLAAFSAWSSSVRTSAASSSPGCRRWIWRRWISNATSSTRSSSKFLQAQTSNSQAEMLRSVWKIISTELRSSCWLSDLEKVQAWLVSKMDCKLLDLWRTISGSQVYLFKSIHILWFLVSFFLKCISVAELFERESVWCLFQWIVPKVWEVTFCPSSITFFFFFLFQGLACVKSGHPLLLPALYKSFQILLLRLAKSGILTHVRLRLQMS